MRFQKRIKILPGITLNLSKSGISTSIGTRGARYTFGNGKSRTTVGVPGSGLSHTTIHKSSPSVKQAEPEAFVPGPALLADSEGMIICPACHKKTPHDESRCIRCGAQTGVAQRNDRASLFAKIMRLLVTTGQIIFGIAKPVIVFIFVTMFFAVAGLLVGIFRSKRK